MRNPGYASWASSLILFHWWKWGSVKTWRIGWPSFVGFRHVMDWCELSEWMKMSKHDKQEKRKEQEREESNKIYRKQKERGIFRLASTRQQYTFETFIKLHSRIWGRLVIILGQSFIQSRHLLNESILWQRRSITNWRRLANLNQLPTNCSRGDFPATLFGKKVGQHLGEPISFF